MPFPFYHIHAPKFCVLAGEADELLNEGIYGKALSLYLQQQLTARGYDVPWIGSEDWGWCVSLDHPHFDLLLAVYGWVADSNPDSSRDIQPSAEPSTESSASGARSSATRSSATRSSTSPSDALSGEPAGTLLDLCVTVGEVRRRFRWRSFWKSRPPKTDGLALGEQLDQQLHDILKTDADINILHITDEFPL